MALFLIRNSEKVNGLKIGRLETPDWDGNRPYTGFKFTWRW
jgi:hypothetical protein